MNLEWQPDCGSTRPSCRLRGTVAQVTQGAITACRLIPVNIPCRDLRTLTGTPLLIPHPLSAPRVRYRSLEIPQAARQGFRCSSGCRQQPASHGTRICQRCSLACNGMRHQDLDSFGRRVDEQQQMHGELVGEPVGQRQTNACVGVFCHRQSERGEGSCGELHYATLGAGLMNVSSMCLKLRVSRCKTTVAAGVAAMTRRCSFDQGPSPVVAQAPELAGTLAQTA